MNEEKTTLRRIAEEKAEQIRNAIERAIDEGAEIARTDSYTSLLEGCYVDGLYMQKSSLDGSISVILKFHSEKISKVFEPSKDDLEKQRKELAQKIAEIEQKLKNEKQ